MKHVVATIGFCLTIGICFAQTQVNVSAEQEAPENVQPGPDAKVENDTRHELNEVVEVRKMTDEYIIIISANGEEQVISRDPEAIFISPEEEEEQ